MLTFEKTFNRLSVCLILTLVAGCATPVPPGTESAGRVRAFGPFFEETRYPDGSGMLAVRPLFSRVRKPVQPQVETEWLWPLASMRDSHTQRNWRVLVWFGTDYDREDPQSRARVWLLPFWFHGRNHEGEPYRALFPIGGHIEPFVGMDRFSFVLFPLYVRHAVNDIEHVGVFWPLFTRTFSRERDISGTRFFPFYGVMHRESEWSRRFALWPIWTDVRYGEAESDSGGAWMLFPVMGRIKTDQQRGWYVLPPLVSDVQRLDGSYRRRHLPWPFVQLQDGPVRRRVYWPIWGSRQSETRQTGFVCWPFWLTAAVDDGNLAMERRRLIPFWDDARTVQVADGVEISRHVNLWPLMIWQREGDRSLFRTLDLWPGVNASADRNWAPYWTLFQRREVAGHVAVDAAWGLWRTRRTPEGNRAGRLWPLLSWRQGEAVRGWRILGGLIGLQQDPAGSRFQLAYVVNVPYHLQPEPEP